MRLTEEKILIDKAVGISSTVIERITTDRLLSFIDSTNAFLSNLVYVVVIDPNKSTKNKDDKITKLLAVVYWVSGSYDVLNERGFYLMAD